MQSHLWMKTLPYKFPLTTAAISQLPARSSTAPGSVLHVQMLGSLCHPHPAVTPIWLFWNTEKQNPLLFFGMRDLCFPFGSSQVLSWCYSKVRRCQGADVALDAVTVLLFLLFSRYSVSVDTSKSWYFWDGKRWKCSSTNGTRFFWLWFNKHGSWWFQSCSFYITVL